MLQLLQQALAEYLNANSRLLAADEKENNQLRHVNNDVIELELRSLFTSIYVALCVHP